MFWGEIRTLPKTSVSEIERIISLLTSDPSNVNNEEMSTDVCSYYVIDVNDVQRVMAELRSDLMLGLNKCTLCNKLTGFFQFLSCTFRYEPLRKISTMICIFIYAYTETKDHAMCKGTIELQLPAIYDILRKAETQTICETLNKCFPPKPLDVASVPERMSRMFTVESVTRVRSDQTVENNEQYIKIAHLTDAHIQPKYATGSAVECGMYICCLEGFKGKGEARMYGEYECNIPERTFHHLLRGLANLNPDFIVYTGDSSPHTIWTESITSKLNCTNLVINALKDILPGVRTYPTLGNHEMYPTNIYTLEYGESKVINTGYAALWRDIAGFTSGQLESMKRLAYYTTTDPVYDKLRILSINTNHYWSTMNFAASLNVNSSAEVEQRQFVEESLMEARNNSEKVIILSHHPVGSSGSIVRATRWWQDVILEYSDVIIMHLSGHSHKDEFHLYIDPLTDEARAINYVAPSATSSHYINPSFRIYYLDKSTYELINFENYYMILDHQKPDEPPPVVKNYDARTLYGMSDLSPESWKNLSIGFLDNPGLFTSWIENKNAKAKTVECSGDCIQDHICRIWFVNYDEVLECLEEPWNIGASAVLLANDFYLTLSATLVCLLNN